MAKKTKATITVARSAITGKFVTKATAQQHPNTTEVEHYKKSTSKTK